MTFLLALDFHTYFRTVEILKLQVKDIAPLSQSIWDCSAGAFRKLFYDAIEFFKLSNLGLAPYSIRRGGATYSFQCSRSLESILLRGRWRALAVARLYMLAQMQISPTSLRLLNQYKKGIPAQMFP